MNKNHDSYIQQVAKIKVIGLGGSGCNTISRLHALNFRDVELIAANTDFFSLSKCAANKKIQLGMNTTGGLGTGGDMLLGKVAAEESFREIISALNDADLLFLTTGLGGGTGSGAIEIVARIASSMDIPTISFVTLPFSFESEKRVLTANEATMNLRPFTNTLITIPNDRILLLSDGKMPMTDALAMADAILLNSILGLRDLVNNSGAMNIDMSYILRELNRSRGAYISRGSGQGEHRIQSAINNAMETDLISANPTRNAQAVIVKFSGNLSVREVNQALDLLRENTNPDIQITPIIDEKDASDGVLTVSIMITGLGATPIPVQFIHKQLEQQEEAALIENDLSKQNQDMIAEHQFDDDLEIPAFLRKGYNPGI